MQPMQTPMQTPAQTPLQTLGSFAASALGLGGSSPPSSSRETEPYKIKVITGRRRGAGTPDAVSLAIIGTNATTESMLLDTGDSGFERGSEVVFTLPVRKDLGTLRRLHISKSMPMDHEPGHGWFLRQIEVTTAAGETTIFPCNSWLGNSDCGAYQASCERNLLPAATELIQGHHEAVHVTAAGMAIPHPDKILKNGLKGVNRQGFGYGGEDSYFYCEGRHHLFGMGVADGVFMWREAGIDSGLMSQALMRKSQAMIQSGIEDVYTVLDSTSRSVIEDGLKGSCTASLLTINQASGQLHAANLGDSGFMVLGPRHGSRGQNTVPELEVKFRTVQLEHEFGRPYQIGHHEHASSASDADLASFYMCRGDLVVMGSDGLLDNVHESSISAALTQLLAQGAGPSRMVQELVRMAYEASIDRKRDTPYAREASEAFNMVYNGGKKDDITVLVAMCK